MPDDKGRGEGEIRKGLILLRAVMDPNPPGDRLLTRAERDLLADAANALEASEQRVREVEDEKARIQTDRDNEAGRAEASERREEGLREAARALLDAMYEHGPDGAEIARAADRLEALLDTPEEEGERDG